MIKYYNMSVYTCDTCSFYTDRKTKFNVHLNTQKHEENTRNKLTIITPLTCGKQNVQRRIFKKKEETNSVTPQPPSHIPQPPSNPCPSRRIDQAADPSHQPQPPSQSVFTLLEIKDNQVLSSRQVNVSKLNY